MKRNSIIIGTRKSPLALWQSEFIKAQLMARFPDLHVELKHIITQGDKTQDSKEKIPAIGGKGLFTAELEEGLRRCEVDLAVHSLKDLPTTVGEEFVIGAIPLRGPIEDILISRSGLRLLDLPKGATVGTSSVRRSSQILRARPDIRIEHLRGNIDSRIRKLHASDGPYDAIVLARAGLVRLGIDSKVTENISFDVMLPAPGQGALGIECRADDVAVREMIQVLHDTNTAAEVGAERAFLATLQAGCNTPVAALAKAQQIDGVQSMVFRGRCLSPNGSKMLEVAGTAPISSYQSLGENMAEKALKEGFREL